ncbi:hypothetical protein SASPL_123497 [Salvia splendens]|uniref:Exostosin GT47 domain-containing protein n=1 Tax=Salvia splendens TaxID=180675 RepID=A0A8X8XQD4_SALSN|nr:hypothetical protein SASPL_123497 [Salvia splendens]
MHKNFFLFSITFLLIPILIISVARISSPYFLYNSAVDECPLGRVYAYNLPFIFNHDLLLCNCTDLHPSIWQCGIFPNHSFGRTATELRRILPENLRKSWSRTNQFALELLFHRRVLRHRCRTWRPKSAYAFYIPFYAGLAVGTNDTADLYHQMLRWVQSQSHWMIFNGSDHFTAIGRATWYFRQRLADPVGNWCSSLLNMPEMSRVTRLTIEKATGGRPRRRGALPDRVPPRGRAGLNNLATFCAWLQSHQPLCVRWGNAAAQRPR